MIIKIDGEFYDVYSSTVKLIDFYEEEDREKYFEMLDKIKKENKPAKIKQYTTPLLGMDQEPSKFYGF